MFYKDEFTFTLFIVPALEKDFKIYKDNVTGNLNLLKDSDAIMYSLNGKFRLIYLSRENGALLLESRIFNYKHNRI